MYYQIKYLGSGLIANVKQIFEPLGNTEYHGLSFSEN